MNLCSGARLFRYTLSLTVLTWTLVSCGGGGGTPPPADGPPFVVNSPRAGSRIAGTVFFSAQPFDPGEVASVSFRAGDVELGTDSDAGDGFRVFLDARDFPAGDLRLTATARGTNGGTSTRSVTVTAVPAPPSAATTGRDGAVLGTTEESGALSTLMVPAGVAEGADVTFEARTKEQVRVATGVDYDALGVTFLGAQEVTASAALGTPLAVTSGGFGPMVQPGQVVVNYTILPDADGDGVGELMVVNTASVTPDGDVISDPVPQIQLGGATVADASGSQTLRSVQDGTVRGAPGTRVEIEAPMGFAPLSVLGNQARFESQVDGQIVEMPVLVRTDFGDPSVPTTVALYLPVLPAGPATLTLTTIGSGEASSPIDVVIEPGPAFAGDPVELLDGVLARIIAALEAEAAVAPNVGQLREARAKLLEASAALSPEEEQALRDVAGFLSNTDVEELLDGLVTSRSEAALFACSEGAIDALGTFAGLGIVSVSLGIGLMVAAASLPLSLGAIAIAAGGAALVGGGAGVTTMSLYAIISEYRNCEPPPPPGGACLPPYKATDLAPWMPGPNPVPSPEGLADQQDPLPPPPPPPGTTGMGSVLPPGGDGCGSAMGAPGALGSALRSQQIGPGDALGDLTGRYLVRIFYGGANTVPFSGISDASGYFYIPLIPAGQPFEAIAIDTVTGETRSLEGVGPEVGRSTYLFFDFLNDGEEGAPTIELDSNTAGEYGDTDLYLFEGAAGDLITMALFSEQVPTELVSYQISDPGGTSVSGASFTGGHVFETGVFELTVDGLYSIAVDGSRVAGGYTLGLAPVLPPTPLTPGAVAGELDTLGERHFYVFSGEGGQTLDYGLAHDGGSALYGLLNVREYLDGTDFYDAPRRRSVRTDAVDRSRSSFYPLPGSGEYLFEVRLADFTADALENHLGSYQVSFSLSP